MNIFFILSVVYVIFTVASLFILRKNLTLGNGAASATLYLFISSVYILVTQQYEYIFYIILGFIIYRIMCGVFFQAPLIGPLIFHISIIFKKLVRLGIPRSRIDSALEAQYGISLTDLEKNSKKN